MVELELKFCIPPERLPALRAAVNAAADPPARRSRLVAHYFDTPDRRLAQHRVALRLRKEGRRWVQTLKAEGDNAVHRLEHNVVLPPAAAPVGAAPPLDVARHAGTAAGERLLKALGDDGAGALGVRYSTDIWRRTFEARSAGGGVEVAFDEGRVTAGDRSAAVCELEFELKDGDPAAMFALAHEWSQRHGLWLSTVSKSAHGDRLAEGQACGAPVHARAPAFDGEHPRGAEVLRATVASGLAQVLGNASEVAGGRFDEEHVHQLRVGIRRLRTAARELGGLADAASALDPGWEAPMVEAFQALGAYRDNDTVARAVAPLLEAAGAPMLIRPDAAAPADATGPAAAVRAPGFQAALLQCLRFVVCPLAPAAPGDDGGVDVRRYLRRRLAKLHRSVERDGPRFVQLPVEQRHRVRKRVKRLRYLSEFVAPLFARTAVERYLKRLRPAQEALGRHNDEWVARGLYQAATESDPGAWFAVGWLQSQQALSAADCRRALKRLAKARRFWR